MKTLNIHVDLSRLRCGDIAASFELGEVLPFSWSLFLYGNEGRQAIAHGDERSGAINIGNLSHLRGSTLTWSIATIILDSDPVDAYVAAVFTDTSGRQHRAAAGYWSVSSDDLFGFVNVVLA